MKRFTNRKSAMLSTEFAVGIMFSVVALFVALSVFNSNLKTMSADAGVKNTWGNSANSKTDFTTYNRSYSVVKVEN